MYSLQRQYVRATQKIKKIFDFSQNSNRKFVPTIFWLGALFAYNVSAPLPIQTLSQPVSMEMEVTEEPSSANTVAKGLPEIELAPKKPSLKTYYSQVTVYNSVPWQTDGDPFTTAAGTHVRDGIIAANCLPFGTLVRMPEMFGDKIFRVEDRLAADKSCFVLDIWQEYSPNAKSFGAPVTKIEILEGSPRMSFAWL